MKKGMIAWKECAPIHIIDVKNRKTLCGIKFPWEDYWEEKSLDVTCKKCLKMVRK